MTEIFKRFNERLEVSDLGNVKKDGKLVEPGHGEVYDHVCCNGKQYRVHIMVAEMFPEICGMKKPYYHAHHINRNQRDNRAVNLVYLSRSEHKRIHQMEDRVSKPVKAYDLDGNYVGRWDSKTQAAEATGADYRHISEVIEGKTRRFTANNLYWFQDDISDEDAHKNLLEIQSTKYESLRGNNHRSHKKNLRKT